MLWFHTTPAYQRASCNMDEANTCFSLVGSYYRYCIARGACQFSIRRLEALSSLFLCNLSERVDSLWDTSHTTLWSLVNCSRDNRVHNQILISVGRDVSLIQLGSFIWVHLSSQKELQSQSVPIWYLQIAVTHCVLVYYWSIIFTCKMFPGQ